MSIISNSNNFICEFRFIFRENNILLETQKNVPLQEQTANGTVMPSEKIFRKCIEFQAATDWFSEPEYNFSAMQLESSSPAPAGCEFIPLRDFFNMSDEKHILLSTRAKGLLAWREKMRFCPRCSTKLADDQTMSAKICPKCGHQYFPQIEPAVIVLVSDKDKYLLVRHAQRIQNLYACISGFVEIGETAEQSVVREVKEESGVDIKNIRYVGSQSWPFPDQLMLAFRAEYAGGEIKIQPEEISEAAWFDKDDLPTIPQPGSVAHNLITGVFG
ncbi:NAD(+) diphosphatase [Treponema parvum]|uniref:NAD(+) diphosphatase n=1 Tax=Treponema parvum TaxID=138851 RepID=A0A975F362_9SPIR|nr:NAD(+) diphosphatase [Treponema parvum]QTQ13533.1 NAD(+) diphosphatase [Treponema parvum]